MSSAADTQEASSQPHFLLPAGVLHWRPLATTTFPQPLVTGRVQTRRNSPEGVKQLWMLRLEWLCSQLGTVTVQVVQLWAAGSLMHRSGQALGICCQPSGTTQCEPTSCQGDPVVGGGSTGLGWGLIALSRPPH